MPTFLTKQNVYDIINSELPDGLFAYSPNPGQFYITAEIDSYAKTIADTYQTMQAVYNNMFVQTADEKIADFEVMYFGSKVVGNLTLEERKARILAKIRSQNFVAVWDLLTFIASYVPEGTFVQIVEYGSLSGRDTWIINSDTASDNDQLYVSELGFTTFLSYECTQQLQGTNADQVWGEGWQQNDPLPAGVGGNANITQTELLDIRKTAYTYEIRIFNYTMPADLLLLFEKDLKEIEPARCAHILMQNQQLSDYGLTVDVPEVDQFTQENLSFGYLLIHCIATDPTSSTGYKGKTYS